MSPESTSAGRPAPPSYPHQELIVFPYYSDAELNGEPPPEELDLWRTREELPDIWDDFDHDALEVPDSTRS